MDKKWNNLKNKFLNFQGISTIGGTDIIGTLISSVFWLYLPLVLSSKNYGEIHYVLSIAGIGFIISLVGTRDVISVFTSKSINLNSTLYLLSLVFGTIAILILTFVFQIHSIVILMGYVINDLALGYILGKKFYKKYFVYVLSQKTLTLILGISFYFIFGYEGILYGLTLSFLPFSIIIFREIKNTKIDFNLLISHKEFVTNNYVLSVIGALRSHMDKIIIAPLLGFVILGNYALAMQVFAILMLVSNVVFKYALPHDAQGITNSKIKNLTILFSIVIAILGIFISPILIPLVFPNFIPAVDAIQIISVAVIPATVGQMLVSKFLGNEKSREVLAARIISLSLMILGIFIFGPIFELQGLALAYLLSSSCQAAFLLVYSKKKFNKIN
ncbi:lipopolysaccharide biosynthesis protein [Nitrosopumilus sp.]|uniref:lipopolysaccharide biosynthesis protein n=1 Tax=Nitrosopumilus sp. TaxID=2024843 RepID=UPI003D105E5B